MGSTVGKCMHSSSVLHCQRSPLPLPPCDSPPHTVHCAQLDQSKSACSGGCGKVQVYWCGGRTDGLVSEQEITLAGHSWVLP